MREAGCVASWSATFRRAWSWRMRPGSAERRSFGRRAVKSTLLARSGKRVSELVAAAPRYTIVKAKVERGAGSREQGLTRVYAELQRRFPDARADTQDGLRLAWRDRWLHVRPSNTEPIIRLIAEAPSGAKGGGGAQELVDEARRICAAS